MDGSQIRTVLWSRLDQLGVERCALHGQPAGFTLAGTAVTAFDGVPAEARYVVAADTRWLTADVEVTLIMGDRERRVALRQRHGRWTVDGADRPDLEGCLDVDLGISPSTNTLPIRRLALPVGHAAELGAAWVRFPEFTVERLAQRYTRLEEDRWLYQSIASGFRAELEVDPDGLVIEYERICRRAAGWPPAEVS